MELALQPILFQTSLLTILNVILQDLDPKSVCLTTNSSSSDTDALSQLTFEIPSIVINCDALDYHEVVKKGIGLGCSVYVMSNDCATIFLDHFRAIQDHLIVNYLIKHLIILDVNEAYDGLTLFDHPTIIEDLPETLILQFNTDLEQIDFFYYWDDNLYNRFFVENGTFLYEKPFFHKEEGLNLGGRELKVSLVVYTPFSYCHYDESNEIVVDGTDVYIVEEFCRKHNCTISYTFFKDGDVYGIIYDNFTGTGIFGATGSRKSHISIGAPYTTIFLNPYTILSTPTQQSKVVNLVPIPKPLSYSSTPLLPFPGQIWGLIAVAYLVGMAALYAAERLSHRETTRVDRKPFENAFFNIITISLFQSLGLHNVMGSYALMVMVLLFFSLILGTLYDGGYASVMTVTRYEKPINTIYDIVESKLTWKGITIAYLYPVEQTEDRYLRKYIDNFIGIPLTEMDQQDHFTSIFLTEITQFGALVNLNNIMNHESATNYMVAKEEICHQYTSVVSHKTWPFMQYMNELIYEVTESGIRKYWEYMVILNRMDYSIQKIVHENDHYMDQNSELVPISVEHIIGALIILGVGHFLSLIVFIIERLRYRFVK